MFDPVQRVLENEAKRPLKDFAVAAVRVLGNHEEVDEVVQRADNITELENDRMTKPDSIYALPDGFEYRFSGFGDCVIGVCRAEWIALHPERR